MEKLLADPILLTAVGIIPAAVLSAWLLYRKRGKQDLKSPIFSESLMAQLKTNPNKLTKYQTNILINLIKTRDKEKQKALRLISKGDVAGGLAFFGKIFKNQEKINSRRSCTQTVQTALEISLLHSSLDPHLSHYFLKEALRLIPNNRQGLNQYAHQSEILGKTDQAIWAYNKILEISGNEE